MREKFYYITNFINEYFEGYYENTNSPKLTCFEDDAIQMNEESVEKELGKLHKLGYTGLKKIEVK